MPSSRRQVRVVSYSFSTSLARSSKSEVKRRSLGQKIRLLAAPSLAVLALLQFSAPGAHAANYYWDIDGATAGAGGATPSGIWSSGGTTWSTSSTGTIATSPYTTALADDLFFSAGVNATGAYTISLTSAQNARSLNFQEGTATISGVGGSINLGGTGLINVNNGAAAIIGANTSTSISGSAGLTKTGVGTLTLSGTDVNTFTGGLNLNGGTLALNFTNLGTPTDLIANTNALSFGGGALAITGNTAGTTNQTFNNTTVNFGGGSLLVNPNGGTDTNIALGSLTATASGGSFLVGRALSSGTGTLNITTTSLPDNSMTDGSGTYGGRVVFANGTANTGYDWATTTSGASPYTLSAYTGYTALDLTAGTDTANSRITASAIMTGSRTTNSLKFENPATAQTLDIGAGNTLTLTNGGLLISGAAVTQGPRISNGSLTVGNASGSYDLVVSNYNATNANGPGNISFANYTTISSNIVNNGSNPVRLVIAGTNPVLLSGAANTFTGGIIINGGSLLVGTASALNNNPITVNANSTLGTSNLTVATTGGITINNNSQLTILSNVGTWNISGAVTGTGGISVDRGGLGTVTANLNSTANTFTGPILFTHRQANQTANLTVNSLADSSSIGEANIVFGATPQSAGSTNGTSNGQNFTLGTGVSSPISLNGRQFELATIQPIQTISNNSSQPFTINTDLLVSGTTGKALTLSGTGTGINTFNGNIANNSAPTTGSTILALQKAASATTLTLASVEGIQIGDAISGTNITSGTTVTAINPVTRVVTLSVASAATAQNAGITITTPNVVNSVQITKTGTSTWVLGGTNTYTGGTVLSAGTLHFTKLAAMPATGNVAAATNTTLTVNVGGAGEWTTGTSGNGTIGGLLAGLGGQTGGTVTYAGTATLGFDTSNASPTTQTFSGVISNVGTTLGLIKQGANTLELSGVNTYTGATTVRAGTLSLTGARTVTAGAITVGNLLSTTATLNISNGNFTTGVFSVGSGDNPLTAGIVNQTGGTLTMSGNQLLLGNGGTGTAAGSNSTGTYNLSNGTLNTIAGGLGVVIGVNTGATGVFNLSGTGNLSMPATSTMQIARSDGSTATNTTGTFSQTGGTATVGILRMAGSGATTGAGGNATLSLTGGTFSAVTFDALSGGNNSNSTINISATADVTLPAFPTARGTGAMATINFDGGTLKPAAASATYMGGLTNAFIKAGGARFDTTNGSITVTQPLLTDPISTGGGLTKLGTNTLTLGGDNTYTGATAVNQGTLLVNGNQTAATGLVTVASGATLGGSGTIGGAVTVQSGGFVAPGTSPGTLTFASGLNVNAGATYNWEHNAGNALGTASTNYDVANITGGTLTVSPTPNTGSKLALYFDTTTSFADTFWDSPQTWNIVTGGVSGANSFDATNISIFVNNTPATTSEGSFSTLVSSGNLQLQWQAASGSNPIMAASVTSGSVAFGNVLRNGTVASAGITLTNTGGDTANIAANVIPGFSISTPMPQVATTVTSATSTVSLNTGTDGTFGGNLVYTANPGAVTTTAIAVSGVVGNATFNTGGNSTVYGDARILSTAASNVNYNNLLGNNANWSSNTTGLTASGGGSAPALATTATILMYNNSATGGGAETVSMQWRTRTTAEANPNQPNAVLSDIVNLTGMYSGSETALTGTGVFVLQMSYLQTTLDTYGLSENSIATSGELRLGWNDAGNWKTAGLGNVGVGGGTATFVGAVAYDPLNPTHNVLGAYGVDQSSPTGGVVWAVLNHNSEFAVIPEPSTLVLGGLALLGFAGVGLRRRRLFKQYA